LPENARQWDRKHPECLRKSLAPALPEFSVETVLELLQAGESNLAIAKECHVSMTTITKLVRVHGIERGRRRISAPPTEPNFRPTQY